MSPGQLSGPEDFLLCSAAVWPTYVCPTCPRTSAGAFPLHAWASGSVEFEQLGEVCRPFGLGVDTHDFNSLSEGWIVGRHTGSRPVRWSRVISVRGVSSPTGDLGIREELDLKSPWELGALRMPGGPRGGVSARMPTVTPQAGLPVYLTEPPGFQAPWTRISHISSVNCFTPLL